MVLLRASTQRLVPVDGRLTHYATDLFTLQGHRAFLTRFSAREQSCILALEATGLWISKVNCQLIRHMTANYLVSAPIIRNSTSPNKYWIPTTSTFVTRCFSLLLLASYQSSHDRYSCNSPESRGVPWERRHGLVYGGHVQQILHCGRFDGHQSPQLHGQIHTSRCAEEIWWHSSANLCTFSTSF